MRILAWKSAVSAGICAVDEIKLSRVLADSFVNSFPWIKGELRNLNFSLYFCPILTKVLFTSLWFSELQRWNSDSAAIASSIESCISFLRLKSVLAFCYCKKQIDVSLLCVCPLIDDKFRHNIVKVCLPAEDSRHQLVPFFWEMSQNSRAKSRKVPGGE